ncbi:hypothetical protein XELAEV_18031047mg [Xenopus laevis]|uniref:Uncharacterized protein n=1 Tax=Xenopus laevis TaxID=8355 RepID=A0A974HFB5_XENLA|nr:hypothetical protein XELAEV_18031047mg [Xenopus laevis]
MNPPPLAPQSSSSNKQSKAACCMLFICCTICQHHNSLSLHKTITLKQKVYMEIKEHLLLKVPKYHISASQLQSIELCSLHRLTVCSAVDISLAFNKQPCKSRRFLSLCSSFCFWDVQFFSCM